MKDWGRRGGAPPQDPRRATRWSGVGAAQRLPHAIGRERLAAGELQDVGGRTALAEVLLLADGVDGLVVRHRQQPGRERAARRVGNRGWERNLAGGGVSSLVLLGRWDEAHERMEYLCHFAGPLGHVEHLETRIAERPLWEGALETVLPRIREVLARQTGFVSVDYEWNA